MNKRRYLHKSIADDLAEKMVFLCGPRQVGKTTLAKDVGSSGYDDYEYLNWDNREHRKSIIDGRFSASAGLHVFDELHKFRQWKNHLKGIYDTRPDNFHILVTGSARLDVYRRGGDSLMGRYHSYRLHPFSVAEALEKANRVEPGQGLTISSTAGARSVFEQLVAYGGFPEPFIRNDPRTLRRWHNQRIERLVREDIRDTENIRDLSALQILIELLPARVGSLLSLNALREDISVAHKTISQWMDILERFYYQFRIYPYNSARIRSLRKEPKLYLWDWSEVPEPAARLENMVASHLLKMCHYLQDAEGHKTELWFLRDQDGREVDLLVTLDGAPWFAVEVKDKDSTVSKHLHYFRSRLSIPHCYQVVGEKGIDFVKDGVRVTSAENFLGALI
jgi:predicted AAA+ superfamily ATPase